MKAKFRTPRKILSVFLCILMLTTSVVIANPFTASAASTVTYKAPLQNYSFQPSLGCAAGRSNCESVYNGCDMQGIGVVGDFSFVFTVYDYNPNALNYDSTIYEGDLSGLYTHLGYCLKSGDWESSWGFQPSRGSCAADAQTTSYIETECNFAEDARANVINTTADDIFYEYYDFDEESGYAPAYMVYTLWTYPVNTARVSEYYDYAISQYGKTNTMGYTAESWNAYIDALNAAEDIVNNGVHLKYKYCNPNNIPLDNNWDIRDFRNNVYDPQAEVYSVWTNLRDAMNGLTRESVTLTYESDSKATISGPGSVLVGDYFSVKVTLNDGYTDSNPKVRVMYNDGKYEDFSGTKSGNEYNYSVRITNSNINKIIPVDVYKNTYTVTVPPSGTGFTASKTGTVTHGENYSFTVTLANGYTQTLPVVKAGTVTLGATWVGNNTYSYTITGVKANTSVSIDGTAVNTYSVGYNLGEGVSKGSESASSIKHFGTATVKLTVDAAHSQNAPAPSVSNGTITYVSKDEATNTYTYELKDVTADTTVTVGNIKKNIYTVNIPEGEGYSLDRKSMNIEHGDNFDFTVTLDAAHSQTPPRAFLAGNELSYTKVGENGYKFNTGAVYAHGDVTISNIKINTYSIELPADTDAFKAADKDGFNSTSITHGNDYKFTVTVDKAYTQTTPTVTLKDGTKLNFDSKVTDSEGNIVYTYTVENVTDHNKISVAAMSKNTYSAVLPFDKTAEASYKVTNTKADSNNVVSGIVYGTDLTFGVALAEQYNRSTVVVKYNDSVLTPDEGGVYTIKNVTENITEGEIVVEGVELNHYYITLPLETETGFVIEVGEGLNAKSVLSGTDFNFKFFLDPAYSDSNPVIKYSADGGDHYSVLTKKDGKYEIKTVLSDCIVVVEGVKKNTYTVKFVDDEGTVLDEHKNVEYGSDVKFTGDTPTKATEKVSETTDKDGNNVLVERKYKFIGWSADTSYVTSNMDVTPIFEVSEVTTTTPVGGGESEVVVTKKTANILFISDEVIVHKETVEKGQAFSGWTEVPVKTSSNPYETYEFLGWDTDKDGNVDYAADETAIADVQDDVTFVAVFKSNLPTQTVNFYSFDGSKLLYTANVKRGERANYGLSSIPSRTDKAYEYTFEGWSYEKNADETTVLDKIVVGENDITVYAAYSKEVIIYTYKYINDGVELQSGTYNFVDGKGTDYKYTGATPLRASSKSTDYTFDGWLATTPDRYSTEYIATYSESVREYDYALPATDGTYAIALDEAVGENIPYNGKLVFTVTLDEGYTQTAPVVKSNGEPLEYEKSGDNSYVFTIVADGADADEIKAKLTNITVATAINHYDVAIGKADGADISSEGFNTEYNGNGTFTVTLKESHNRTAPVVAAAEGDRVVVTLVSAEGDVYTYKVSEIKSDATITVATKINEYSVVMKNWDGKEVVFEGVLEHGQTPTYTNPSKPTDKFGGYTFIGWDLDGDGVKDVDAIANVKNDINATAVYTCNHTHAEDPTGTNTAWVLASTDKATCTETGTRHYKCSYPGCTETKDWTIPARNHKMGEYTVTLAPTCTNDGSKIHYCENAETDDYAKCNHSATAVVPKLGHAYGEWKTIVAPTCTEKGKAERVCANDPSHKEYKDVPATGHHDSDEDYVCDDCGLDLGHCSKCICHKGNILSKVLRYICTLLTKTFHKPIKCCKDMDWYGDKISSIS